MLYIPWENQLIVFPAKGKRKVSHFQKKPRNYGDARRYHLQSVFLMEQPPFWNILQQKSQHLPPEFVWRSAGTRHDAIIVGAVSQRKSTKITCSPSFLVHSDVDDHFLIKWDLKSSPYCGNSQQLLSHAPWHIFSYFASRSLRKKSPTLIRKKPGQVLVPELTSNTSCIKEKCPFMSTTNKWFQYAMSFPEHIWSWEFPIVPGWTIGFDVCRICRLKNSRSFPKITVFNTLGLSLHCSISCRKDQIYRNFCPAIFLRRREPFQGGHR